MGQSIDYTVTVTDWTERRGYRDSGRGWRVRCFGLARDGWNDLGHTVYEQFFRGEAKARKEAARVAATWNAKIS